MIRTLFFVLWAAFLSQPADLRGQEPVEGVLSGQLLRSGLPADSGVVVLHRVTPEEAGAVDSVSVDSEGRFTLVLPNLPVPGSGELYFAAHRYQGIVYPGPPVDAPAALDSLYVIQSFATETAPPGGLTFPIFIREFWIEEAPGGWQVTDAIIVQNPGEVTYVADGAEGVVWQYPLPGGARGSRLIEAGPTPGDVVVTDAGIVARNPVPPGESYFMVQYELDSLSVELPLPGGVEIARLILREPAPAITVEGLARQPPMEIEAGVTYQQWVGQNLQDQVVRLRPGEEPGVPSVVWFSIVLALLLMGAGVYAVNRGGRGRAWASPTTPSGHGSAGRSRRDVLIEIAQLDEGFGAQESPDGKARTRYLRKREALLAELSGGSGEAGPV